MQRTNRRPTICQVLHGLRVGGAEVLAARLVRRFREDFHFVFYCLDELGSLGQELRDEGFTVEVLGRRPGFDWHCSVELAQFLRRQRVELIHAHQYTPFFYALTARLLFRQPPVLFTEHGRWFPDYPRPKRVVANRLLLQQRDRTVGVGEAVRQALIHNEGLPAERVGVVYNGVELDRFNNSREERDVALQAMGLERGDFVLLQVARLDPLKDHPTALLTVDRLRHEIPNLRLVLVGEGPEERSIRDLIHRLGIDHHVRLLGLRSDVARLLHAADVLLLTSKSEGVPLTAIEAMAAGLPVVATSVGGLPEVVQNGKTGWLVPAGDPAALAERILVLARDPGLRQQMGRLGRERAQSMFAEDKMHHGYRRLYDEMLHN
jgi:glycosyltransferase involved in cell wall biosynthesis